MRHYVNADAPTSVATVHKADCPYCNEGRGRTGLGPVFKTSEWTGPYATGEEAFKAATRTGLKRVRRCGQCDPWQ
jgi:hypothetical protein